MTIADQLAGEFRIPPARALEVIALLDGGHSIPFLSRYRKESTGGLDDQQLRALSLRLSALRNLEERRARVAAAIAEQGRMTRELSEAIAGAATLTELEDLYRPFRPRRRTRADLARERGLESLALAILNGNLRGSSLAALAEKYADAACGVPDAQAALTGARDILAQRLSEDARLLRPLRSFFRARALLESRRAREGDSVYRLYYEYRQPALRIPAHRVLALNRGEREGWLKVSLSVDRDEALALLRSLCVSGPPDTALQLSLAAADAWDRLIFPSLERELRSWLSDRAGEAAVAVFADNLRHLLMQRPLKGRVVLGMDPGYRSGCKLAVVDPFGGLLETAVVFVAPPATQARRAEARKTLEGLIKRHGVSAIAIGNGTASRETEAFVSELLRDLPGAPGYTIVSEAGASVYSASPLAAGEFPRLDVTLRSAVSIARRLQDPLSELVKIDPKALGVGQYQHDLRDARLGDALDGVVEDCVNAVGVELSTASVPLLARVAGIGPSLAKNIAAYREAHGFSSREDLKKVPRLGHRAFEQCAGFLRLRDGAHPLDATGVHPENYSAAAALAGMLGFSLSGMRGGAPAGFSDRVRQAGADALAKALGLGLPTFQDMVDELQKPGRDPREALAPVALRSAALDIDDLSVGMALNGTVRNVADFGAFVDIGVGRDGLLHVSRMSERFVRHPGELLRVGDPVRVWITEISPERNRIGLSMTPPENPGVPKGPGGHPAPDLS